MANPAGVATMKAFEVVVPAVVALLSAIAISTVAGNIALAIRRRRYAAADLVAAPEFIEHLDLSKPKRSDVERQLDEALKTMEREEHLGAIRLQNRSIFHLIGACVLLLTAFVLFAASATMTGGNDAFRLFSSAFDCWALGLVAVHFVLGTQLRRKWIVQRSKVEFLRQWSTVDFVLLGIGTADLTTCFMAQKAGIEVGLSELKRDVTAAVVDLSTGRMNLLRERLGALTSLQSKQANFYLHRRPVRQARWFAASKSRIQGQDSSRVRTLLFLFLSCAIFSAAKFYLVGFGPRHSVFEQTVEFLFLVGIGVSTTTAAVYFGQNLRSLSHRYRGQSRDIERWFERHAGLIQYCRGGRVRLAGEKLDQFGKAVLEFEDLMVDELLDWIEITDLDAMELAPS